MLSSPTGTISASRQKATPRGAAAFTASARLKALAAGDKAALATAEDEGPITALMVACRTRRADVAEALVGSSAIDKQSAGGFTALYLAAEEGDERIVNLLLQNVLSGWRSLLDELRREREMDRLRTEIDDASTATSSAERLLPSRTMPYTEMLLPKRA